MFSLSPLRRTAADAMTRGNLTPAARQVTRALASTHTAATLSAGESTGQIIEFATTHVPFYQQFKPGTPLCELPVVDKLQIREHLDQFLAEGADPQKLAFAQTSGSTGIPFKAYFDAGKVLRHRAGLVGSYAFLGADPFGSYVHCRAQWSNDRKTRLVSLAKGQLPYSGSTETTLAPEAIAAWIRRHKPVTIMGYASYIEQLLYDFEERGVDTRGAVAAVIGGSEPASGYLEEASQRLFGLTPHMRYSSQELGIVGVTADDPSVYHLDTSSFFIELLREDSDEPVSPGELGRIVVTDLHNRAMPLIRYDIGDLARHPMRAEEPIVSQLTGLAGRRLDVILAGTAEHPRKIHAMNLWSPTSKLSEIRQFQLRQHAIGRFTWVLNAERSAQLEDKLREILRSRVGDDAACAFEYIDEVPVKASGKRQFFVSEISLD